MNESNDLDTAAPSAAPITGDVRFNVADRLAIWAEQTPDMLALVASRGIDERGQIDYQQRTFGELNRDATQLARGLIEIGVQPGDRLALLVPAGIEFVCLVYALLRSGAVAVLVDPGSGRRNLINCLADSEPKGFVAISAAHAVRSLLPWKFPQARHNVTVGKRWFWRGVTLAQLRRMGRNSEAALPATRRDDPAAIIFTSGSTGPPKGVLYQQQTLDTQVESIGHRYDIGPGGIDLACFPLFGLFNASWGVTTVMPAMDFSRPATANPRELLTAANDWKVTQAFASPAVWDKLSRFCADQGGGIPSLRKAFSCGAPVPAGVVRRTLAMIHPDAEMHTPYGATEALPIATAEAREILEETAEKTRQGRGICVGRRFENVEWRVVQVVDGPLSRIDDTQPLRTGEIGELIVRGPQVTREYATRLDSNPLAKIADGDSVWHRMGDVGYFDNLGRFWYCGRKDHRVKLSKTTLWTICCEAIFDAHPDVHRSALVGVETKDNLRPTIVVEPSPEFLLRHGDRFDDHAYQGLAAELQEIANEHGDMRAIGKFLFRRDLPVDVRHNSKIFREKLAVWARSRRGGMG